MFYFNFAGVLSWEKPTMERLPPITLCWSLLSFYVESTPGVILLLLPVLSPPPCGWSRQLPILRLWVVPLHSYHMLGQNKTFLSDIVVQWKQTFVSGCTVVRAIFGECMKGFCCCCFFFPLQSNCHQKCKKCIGRQYQFISEYICQINSQKFGDLSFIIWPCKQLIHSNST